ncbi:hypothetical protein JST97_28510 [bacterium]|nr:hypothetical protein [bacterium]
MPQFRFKVLTPDGKLRKGSLTSASLEDARHQIEQTGLSVVELSPVEVVTAGPVARATRPNRWTRHLVGYPMAACLAGLGLLWGLADWKAQAHRPARPAPARDATKMAEECKFSGHFEGRVEGGAVPPRAVLVLQFPEVPYQVSQPWSQGPNFRCDIAFQAARKPSRCLARLLQGQMVLAETQIQPLQEGKTEFLLHLAVGERQP